MHRINMLPALRMRVASAMFAALVLPLAAAQNGSATVWGIRSTAGSAPDFSTAPVELFSINEDGSSYTDHGNLFNATAGTDTDFDALAISPSLGLMAFEIIGDGASSRLTSINTASVTATAVGPSLAGREIRGAGFDVNNQLWAVDFTSAELLRINPQDGQILGTPIQLNDGVLPISFSGNGIDLAVTADGDYFLTTFDEIFSLDVQTGELTQVHMDATNFGNVGGAFSGENVDDLLVLDVFSDEDFARYETDSGFVRTVLFTLPTTINSGRGDLAALIPLVVPEPGSGALFLLGACI